VYARPADSVVSGAIVPIRRADRLFDILRILRSAKAPVTAASLADELEVTVRTVYRDVATLQARRVPIEGAAGIGYVLRGGFDLPPLMFTEDEAEAIAVGVRMLARTGDPGLQKAAESVLSRVAQVVPDPLRDYLNAAPVYVATRGAPVPQRRDLPATIRYAIRDARKMKIAYEDEQGRRTGRVIQPFCGCLLRRGDAGLRVVRAVRRDPPFSHRPDRLGGDARRAVHDPRSGDRAMGGGARGALRAAMTRPTDSQKPSAAPAGRCGSLTPMKVPSGVTAISLRQLACRWRP
jgi:biotin operon repressor